MNESNKSFEKFMRLRKELQERRWSRQECVFCHSFSKNKICRRCVDFLGKKFPKSAINFLKLVSERPQTYRELMNKLELSRERVRQLSKALIKEKLIKAKTKNTGVKRFKINPEKTIRRF